MSVKNIQDFIYQIFTLLGGVTTCVTLLAVCFRVATSTFLKSWFGSIYKEKILRLEKKLANSEKLNDKHINALIELHSIKFVILPEKSHEDQEWEDALIEICHNAPLHRKLIFKFTKEHGATLPEDVRNHISNALTACGDSQLLPIEPDKYCVGEHIKTGAMLYDEIEAAEKALRASLNKNLDGIRL